MPNILALYLGAHRDVNVELHDRLSYLVVKAVADGSADIGITAQAGGGEHIEFLPSRRDRLVLVTHNDHPLAAEDAVAFHNTPSYDYLGLSEPRATHAFLFHASYDLATTLSF